MDHAPPQDRFGNALDPAVGFARGTILSGSEAEARRMRQGWSLIRARGEAPIGIFTGNRRELLYGPGDLPLAEEWLGPARFWPALEDAVRAHLDATPAAGVAVLNRGSGALVATVLALAARGRVVSVVPSGVRSHPALGRGATLAGARLEETARLADVAPALRGADLLAITPVTSSLARMPEDDIAAAIAAGRAAGVPVMVDDAYGARLRPVLHGGTAALRLGADLVVTNADKAGLPGPRAGILAGDPALVARVGARAAELGMEARAPVALGVLRGLQAWSPEELRREAREGAALTAALRERLGPVVQATDLGPLLQAEDALAIALARAGLTAAPIVPVEATAALGMRLLMRQGVLTTNVAGQPGAHPALRLKPAGDALARGGGAEAVAAAVDTALGDVAGMLGDADRLRALLLGPRH